MPQSEPEAAALREGRVVRPPVEEVRPLYSAGRVLQREVFEAERILTDAVQVQQEMEAQSAALLEAAKAEAEALVQAARNEAEALRAEARASGLQEAQDETQRVLASVQTQLEELRRSYPQDVQRIAYRYARKVLDVEFAVRPERIVELCSKVLERAKQYQRIRFRVHPEDMKFVQDALEALKQQLVFSGDVAVVEDRELERHGVRIETEMGTYLGSVEEQLRPLRDALGLRELLDEAEGQDG